MKKPTKALLKKRAKREAKRQFKQDLETWKNAVIIRDMGLCQFCLKELPIRKQQHPHHIISLQSVKRKHIALLKDINNGILLCGYCHKFAPYSPHQGGFEFVLWLKENKIWQYNYLKTIIETEGCNKI